MSAPTTDTGLKPEEQRIVDAIAYLKEYINSYDKQRGYEKYAEVTVINDLIYGLGVALWGDDHRWHAGFQKTLVKIREVLK